MKKNKIIILTLFSFFLLIGSSLADNFDNAKLLFDNLSTQKDMAITYLDQQSIGVSNQYNLYGKAITKTVVYKSLVCLGAIKNPFNDKIMNQQKSDLKTTILQEYVSLFSKIKAYELGLTQDFTGLQIEIKECENKSISAINELVKNQYSSISGLILSVSQYTSQNTELLSKMGNNIQKLEDTNNVFENLNKKITNLGLVLVQNNTDFFDGLKNAKNLSNNILNSNLQKHIDAYARRYKKLPGLKDILNEHKKNILITFKDDFDGQINNSVGEFYDFNKYTQIKKDLSSIKKDFYLEDELICQNVLSKYSDTVENKLLKLSEDIISISSGVDISIQGLQNTGLSDEVKQTAINKVKNFYGSRLNSDLQFFRTFIGQTLYKLYKEFIDIKVESGSQQEIT